MRGVLCWQALVARCPGLGNGRFLLLTLFALFGQLLEVNVKLSRIVICLYEGLHLSRKTFRILKAIAALGSGLNLLLQSLVEHISKVVVGMLSFLVDLSALVPPLTIVSHRVEGIRDKLCRSFVVTEIFGQQMNVRHSIALLLVAGLVELPLVDIV